MAEPTDPHGSDDGGFLDDLDDLDDLDAYDAEHEQPSLQQRLADASMAVIVGAVALIALVAGIIGFGIGTQVGGESTAKSIPAGGSGGGGGGGGNAPADKTPARVLGPVTKVKKPLVTVTDVGGASVLVGVGPKANVFTTKPASPSAVRKGSRVMVVTTRPGQAARIILAPPGKNAGTIVVATKAGSLSVAGIGGKSVVFSTVGADFVTAQVATLEAVTVGKRVVVFGLRGKAGVAANTLVILPGSGG